MKTTELKALLAGATPGPWDWLVHDYSCASLGVMPDPGYGDPLVMSSSPCSSCQKHAKKNEHNPQWQWGRCCTPSDANARMIAAAPDLAAEVIRLREGLARIAEMSEGDADLNEWGAQAVARALLGETL